MTFWNTELVYLSSKFHYLISDSPLGPRSVFFDGVAVDIWQRDVLEGACTLASPSV